ncbi:MAG: phosphatidylethanolamine N-methyltransferase family protein [Deltaproteobacteria bacterium]|nr:phosphatidylethanolamine N-methyltransferase family protein [Deltaproteobacteria bacterium]
MNQTSSNTHRPWLRFLVRLASTFCAMSGFRLERLNVVWVVSGALSLIGAHALMKLSNPNLIAGYWVLTLSMYYVGNSFILASRRIPGALIARFGEDSALRIYDTALGLMFLNQGLGVSCMGSLAWSGDASLFSSSTTAIGIVFFAIGLVTKIWATMLVGVDIYYYHDMFLGRPTGGFVSSGPYRFLANPMYGVGQLHAYGYGLLTGSIVGLAAAAVCHSAIYVFYFVVERPFVRRSFPAGSKDDLFESSAGTAAP